MTVELTNNTGTDQFISATGDYVLAGGVVFLPDDIASQLVERDGWDSADVSPPTKADLIAQAEAAGVEVKSSWPVAKITEALAQATEQKE